ncbi:MAG: hypothetical protein UX39_C0024G0004 [Candidatus Magasanikbacteria bacterium GW2011_GWA2_46_17]|uniref:Uncharacterized protein n=1 Tax=Candidatus Magasanikbacteria bacterium GW2011_GWA2_46_17 TaxID=1619042 RepID=A0A0G1NY64_9BACT|nr:MAG: hypothetical protein UX39_C0024G0004 [Candidatus Magasanikbacteria bacterium GW2011_GWA2_46_17]
MPATIRSLVRQLDDHFLPRTFGELCPGDIFHTNGVEDWGLLGIGVTCFKLAKDQSQRGNAVMTWGPHAGRIVRLDLTDEVELEKSGASEGMNEHLKQLRIEKEQKRQRGY